MEDDEYVKAVRLTAEMLGHMPRPGDINVSQTTVNSKVLVVRDQGPNWEEKLKAQQTKLIEHARD